ncbi:N-acetylmuramoyl-L-alanine amidase [Streptomyces phaeolivaceus]|uniref:N-acetylmuramoyl-L-alanine amidase n=1 Tax=Streptomyces phaeolivaceus TaxID=2653200 RepID=A0A5P8K5A5_9ACTN|nr:peptidoglycan-binding protein [Streptomyces phaeolivaceus]QFQ97817.1 N-acetylmuramoyl-L-alanine amidase [Streptomyces phaeolivaceus]
MATPLSAAAFEAALRAEGVTLKEHSNWSTHNRNAVGAWGPAQGVMLHHTAGSNSVALCRTGMTNLPGPLCIAVIAKDGTVHLVGYGRTNHAGRGSTAAYDAVRHGTAIPSRPGADAVDGNAHFYGFEIENLGNGRDPYPDAQLAAVERVAAAVCRAHGWGAGRVIGHKEWTTRKIDPTFSMAGMRTRITKRLTVTPAGGTQPDSPVYEPFPGAAFFTAGRRSAIVTAMGRRLVAEGCGRYEVGPGPSWTAADRRSYAAWQHKLGYSGSDADGVPGATSWAKLRVPRT